MRVRIPVFLKLALKIPRQDAHGAHPGAPPAADTRENLFLGRVRRQHHKAAGIRRNRCFRIGHHVARDGRARHRDGILFRAACREQLAHRRAEQHPQVFPFFGPFARNGHDSGNLGAALLHRLIQRGKRLDADQPGAPSVKLLLPQQAGPRGVNPPAAHQHIRFRPRDAGVVPGPHLARHGDFPLGCAAGRGGELQLGADRRPVLFEHGEPAADIGLVIQNICGEPVDFQPPEAFQLLKQGDPVIFIYNPRRGGKPDDLVRLRPHPRGLEPDLPDGLVCLDDSAVHRPRNRMRHGADPEHLPAGGGADGDVADRHGKLAVAQHHIPLPHTALRGCLRAGQRHRNDFRGGQRFDPVFHRPALFLLQTDSA